tara:strand:+ start:372 stop:512 length:141 start_codon:yes stop_codon:yes gene_type:complete
MVANSMVAMSKPESTGNMPVGSVEDTGCEPEQFFDSEDERDVMGIV